MSIASKSIAGVSSIAGEGGQAAGAISGIVQFWGPTSQVYIPSFDAGIGIPGAGTYICVPKHFNCIIVPPYSSVPYSRRAA